VRGVRGDDLADELVQRQPRLGLSPATEEAAVACGAEEWLAPLNRMGGKGRPVEEPSADSEEAFDLDASGDVIDGDDEFSGLPSERHVASAGRRQPGEQAARYIVTGIYEILKKRLIDELPDERTIADIAEEYAEQVKMAEDSGYIVAASLEQITEQVRETYPLHPSFKHLVALFKENEGFRQTRGLMQFTARLLKSVEERNYDDVFLIGTAASQSER
jgi:hypothetical protein